MKQQYAVIRLSGKHGVTLVDSEGVFDIRGCSKGFFDTHLQAQNKIDEILKEDGAGTYYTIITVYSNNIR